MKEEVEKKTIRIKQPRELNKRRQLKPTAVQTIDTDYINNKRGDWDKFGSFKQVKESSSVRI